MADYLVAKWLCGFCHGKTCPHTASQPCTVGEWIPGRGPGRRCTCMGNDPGAEPEPRVMFCPSCGVQHVDEGEWATKPHKTHLCATCGHEWRPEEHPTVGVACWCGGDPEFQYHGPSGCGTEKRWADWAASPGATIIEDAARGTLVEPQGEKP